LDRNAGIRHKRKCGLIEHGNANVMQMYCTDDGGRGECHGSDTMPFQMMTAGCSFGAPLDRIGVRQKEGNITDLGYNV
jgi:hypothetical protein